MNSPKPFHYNFVSLGKNLKEVSRDYIRTENQNVTSRWFHTKNVDLFVWQDEKENIIKQQVSFYGLISEWNLVNGVRTGVIIEEESSDKMGIPGNEMIQFDEKVSEHTIKQSMEIIKYAENMHDKVREILLINYEKSPTLDNMSSRDIFEQYSYLRKPKKALFKWLKSMFKKKSE